MKMPLIQMVTTVTITILMAISKTAIHAEAEDGVGTMMLSDRRLGVLDSEASDIFNKTLASKHGSSRHSVLSGVVGPRSARTPPTAAIPHTTTRSPPQTSPSIREMPSYAPPSRAFFTPPLPPEFLNPFHDKPTLRGSNSDVNMQNRRPIPPPPPRLPPETELIPIRPPEVGHQDTRKKTLNTPSFKKIVEVPYSESTSSTTTNSKSVNETFDFVPMLPYSSISRILSGGSGRKHDTLQDNLDRPHFDVDTKASRTIKQEVVKSLIPPSTRPTSTTTVQTKEVNEARPNVIHQKEASSSMSPVQLVTTIEQTNVDDELTAVKEQEVTESRVNQDLEKESPEIAQLPELPEPRTRHVLGIAWDIHVYLIATLFALLAICSTLNIVRISSFKRLLTRGYFLTLHGFLFIIGCIRSVYLFYDAYNINHSFPEPVSRLLLNIVFPLLTSSFAILFLFLLLAGEVKVINDRLQRASVLSLFIVLHLVLTISVDLFAGNTPYATLFSLIWQCLFVVLCVTLGLSYLYLYKSLSHSSLRKQGNIFGSTFSDCHRPTLSHAVRVTLATAMLSLLMAAVQLYGMLGVYEVLGEEPPHPWLWWGFQFSVRVIEISMCFLMSWAGIQPLRCEDEKETQSHCLSSGFARGVVSCGANTSRGSDTGTVDDMYPAICSSNQAIHNYSLRTGKQVYDDSFPVSLHSSSRLFAHNTTERRSLKKHPVEDELLCGTLVSRRLQPSPSMLVAENGFVRFRSLADSEQPVEDTFSPSSRDDFT
ncbi:uncharacterized protein LOC142329567 [Lycorma delicatula]|uniref:uncharacterized protein LOC142329567 n=1 Tax=Lycorma delicatula TaxID=130591 RepID=UPI003F518C12